MSLHFNSGNWQELGGIQAIGRGWKIDLLEYNTRLEIKMRGLFYEL